MVWRLQLGFLTCVVMFSGFDHVIPSSRLFDRINWLLCFKSNPGNVPFFAHWWFQTVLSSLRFFTHLPLCFSITPCIQVAATIICPVFLLQSIEASLTPLYFWGRLPKQPISKTFITGPQLLPPSVLRWQHISMSPCRSRLFL